MGWRVCIDYKKLNTATRKDHFSLLFIDQMVEKLVGQKTTFTYPFGTFAYRPIPFGLYNVPATFQRCMISIFLDIVESFLKIFMDDFSIFGLTFSECLNHLRLILERCKEKHLVLN